MITNIHEYDFSGTSITTPLDKTKALSIINAKNTIEGLSIISFNLKNFMLPANIENAYFVLSRWAVQPINMQTEKFLRFPEDGAAALYKRVEILISYLSKHSDMPVPFIETASQRMKDTIEKEIFTITRPKTAYK